MTEQQDQKWDKILAVDADALAVSLELGAMATGAYIESRIRPIDDSPTALTALAVLAALQKQVHVQQLQFQEQRVANLLAFAGLTGLGIPVALLQAAAQEAADLLGLAPVDEDDQQAV